MKAQAFITANYKLILLKQRLNLATQIIKRAYIRDSKGDFEEKRRLITNSENISSYLSLMNH